MGKKNLMEYLLTIEDPRRDLAKKHNLMDTLVIAVCGILSGFDSWTDIEDYGLEKSDWFSQFLELPNGIPSHDTFGRIFSIISAEHFERAFFEWLKAIQPVISRQIISIDGKFLKGSLKEAGRPRSAISMVSAWASEAGICIGQKKSELKKEEGEKRTIESLIDLLFLKGCIVTIDANGATTRITEKIIEKNGDYVIGLKENQKALLNLARTAFEMNHCLASYHEENKGHGRKETRTYMVAKISECEFRGMDQNLETQLQKWEKLRSFIKVDRIRETASNVTREESYYFSSLEDDAEELARAIRSHWAIENKLHWTLDVTFREDHCQVRKGDAPENLAVVRRMAFNMLKQEPTKISMRRKRNKCNWNNSYLLKVLHAQPF